MSDGQEGQPPIETPPKKPKRPFKIHGADGRLIEIPPGEFYINTKDRCRRMMLNSLPSDARRVYACLELGTVGFQREMAVKQTVDKKVVPMRPRDVIRATQLSPRRFRLAMDCLDAAGLAKRVADDDKGLRGGHVRLYSWAVPRSPVRVLNEERASSFPDWFPVADKTLKTLVSHLKLKLLSELDEEARNPILAKLDEAARSYEKARNEVVRALETVSAPRKKRPYKKTTDTTERTGDASSSSDPETAETTTTTNPPVPAQTPAPIAIDPELSAKAQIAEALAEHTDAGSNWAVGQLITQVRAIDENATAAEIVHFCHADWHKCRSKGNPLAYIVKCVVEDFEPGSPVLAQYRARQRAAAEEEERRAREWIEQCRRLGLDPETGDPLEDKAKGAS